MLKIQSIVVKYGGAILALDNVSLHVEKGSIVGLFGANGAGKTTALRTISGLLRSEDGEIAQGTVTYKGKRIDKAKAEDIVRMGIAQVMEGRRIFGQLTVHENLMAGSYVRKDRANIQKDIDLIFSEYFPALKALKNQTAGYLSGGEQQMLAIARALMSKPELVLLDEPSMGLAPLITKNIFEIIAQIKENENTSILLVEQNVKAGLSICDYGYVMENGNIALEGPKSDLITNGNIEKYYLY